MNLVLDVRTRKGGGMMQIDKAFQKQILVFLSQIYPRYSNINNLEIDPDIFWAGFDGNKLRANLKYMKEKRWLSVTFENDALGPVLPLQARITAAGIDYLAKISD